MLIILEGPDGSGKSTLAQALSSALGGIRVVPGQGPEKYPGEALVRLSAYREEARLSILSDTSLIYDRHPSISGRIYPAAMGGQVPDRSDTDWALSMGAIIVYCRFAGGLGGHQRREDIDTEEYIEKLHTHHSRICELYDEWAVINADIVYDRSRSNGQMVIDFIKGAMK